MCLLTFPGSSQWPRAGASGALSPNYDGGLHSLVSFLLVWGGDVPLWEHPGEGMEVFVDKHRMHVESLFPEQGRQPMVGSSACLLWPCFM